MKKSAFSLIELIFVIVLIGILTGIGFYLSRPDYTRQDAQFTLLKLKEARYRAIGHDALSPAGCVTLTSAGLTADDTAPRHEIRSIIAHDAPSDTICFDGSGFPHSGNDISVSTRLHTDVTILFTKGDQNSSIRVFSGTGYAIIPCNN